MSDCNNPGFCTCRICLAPPGEIPNDGNFTQSWGHPPPPPIQTNIVNHYYGLQYNINVVGTSSVPDTVQMLQQAQPPQLLSASQRQIAAAASSAQVAPSLPPTHFPAQVAPSLPLALAHLPAQVAPSLPPAQFPAQVAQSLPQAHLPAPSSEVSGQYPQVAAPLPQGLGLLSQLTASPAQTALPGPPEIQGEIGRASETSPQQQQGEGSELKHPLPLQQTADKARPSTSSNGTQTSRRPVEPQQSNGTVTQAPVQNVQDSENGSVPSSCDVETVAKLIRRDGSVNSARHASFLSYLVKSVPEAKEVVLGLHSNILAAKIQEAKLQQITMSSLDQIFLLIPNIFAETYAAWLKVGMLNDDNNDTTDGNSVGPATDKEGTAAEIQRQTCAIEGYNHQWHKTEVSLPFPELGKRALDKQKWNSTSASTDKPGKEKRERLVEVLKMRAGKAEDGQKAGILLQFFEGAYTEGLSCSGIAEVARNELQLMANQLGDEAFIREFNDAFKSENKENEDESTTRTLCRQDEEIDESEPSTMHQGQSTSVKIKNMKDESKQERATGNKQGTTRKRRKTYGYGWSKPLPETPEKKERRSSARVTRSSSSNCMDSDSSLD